ncbi:hypothetical protein L1049_014091 [Liquidambar formosana]|uniref:Acid phosphatase/vanadium-dependent haloperoxidase-related protein n=1 Tax=Liquidambar formosana TaxID=63359 RepID=A0AAP0WUY7_LIQFO
MPGSFYQMELLQPSDEVLCHVPWRDLNPLSTVLRKQGLSTESERGLTQNSRAYSILERVQKWHVRYNRINQGFFLDHTSPSHIQRFVVNTVLHSLALSQPFSLKCGLQLRSKAAAMDSVVIKPSFRASFYPINPKTKYLNTKTLSIFKSSHFKKQSSSTASLSHKTLSNPKTLKFQCNYSFRHNPFWVSIPILQKWVSCWKSFTDSEKAIDEYNGNYLQNGGFGMALISVTTTAKVRISPFVATLATNPTFVSGFFAWLMAQSIKVFLNFFVERKWDFRILFASGGMPSSHSALCTALTTSVALCHGVADSLFPVCLGFSLIVMYDAIGVRRHAGMQAEVLNMIVEDLFEGHPVSQRKLKELLGHTPLQVLAGALLGIMVACVCCQGCLVAI